MDLKPLEHFRSKASLARLAFFVGARFPIGKRISLSALAGKRAIQRKEILVEQLFAITFAVVSAIVVPFISVWMAQRLTALHEWRRDARALLLKFAEDQELAASSILKTHQLRQAFDGPSKEALEFIGPTLEADAQKQKSISVLQSNALAATILFDSDGYLLHDAIYAFLKYTVNSEKPEPFHTGLFEKNGEVLAEIKTLWSKTRKRTILCRLI